MGGNSISLLFSSGSPRQFLGVNSPSVIFIGKVLPTVGVPVVAGRGWPVSPSSKAAGLTGPPASHSFGCTGFTCQCLHGAPASRRTRQGGGRAPQGPPGHRTPGFHNVPLKSSDLGFDPLSHRPGNLKLGEGWDWFQGPTESHGRARFRHGAPASAQSHDEHLYSLTLGPLDGELVSPCSVSGRPEGTIYSRGGARGKGPLPPRHPSSRGWGGGRAKDPFHGLSSSDLRNKRGRWGRGRPS